MDDPAVIAGAINDYTRQTDEDDGQYHTEHKMNPQNESNENQSQDEHSDEVKVEHMRKMCVTFNAPVYVSGFCSEHNDNPYRNDAEGQPSPGGDGGANGGGSLGDDDQSAKHDGERTDICRDFMKNVCSRGSRCKYYHPPQATQQQSSEREEFKFCIDYQNPRGCMRGQCRYVHAKRDDADRYKRSGEVTLALACAIASVTSKDNINGIPFCKEFKMGKCQRGQRCRYWHIDPDTEREQRFGGGPPRNGPMMGGGGPGAPPPSQMGGGGMSPWAGGGNMPSRNSGMPQPTQQQAYMQQQQRPMPNAPMAYNSGAPPQQQPVGYDWAREDAMRAAKRGRYDQGPGQMPGMLGNDQPSFAIELERVNAELRKVFGLQTRCKHASGAQENDSLQRELARERERYEDLYALFRQHQHQAAAVAHAASSVQAVVQQQTSVSGSQPIAHATAVPMAVSAPGGMAGMHSSNDVAVHWSTVQMHR